ncbi:MAG TPA: TrkA family potassium uptake protein [Candidatus Limnocylindrales bacterium]|nr:TrkA family potassium uptake protein [Candidatus Limnocylindrales bacterium]
MKIVIVGCGRVGAVLAGDFDAAGHDVVVLDLVTEAFDRLPSGFGGSAVRGDGTDEDILRRAGTEGADVFIAMTEGDNRNVMAAQLAHEALGVRRVIAKINDPVRAEAYADLGIATVCRTNLISDAVNAYLGLPVTSRAGVLAPTGSHPGGEHHRIDGEPDAGPVTSGAAREAPRAQPASFAGPAEG